MGSDSTFLGNKHGIVSHWEICKTWLRTHIIYLPGEPFASPSLCCPPVMAGRQAPASLLGSAQLLYLLSDWWLLVLIGPSLNLGHQIYSILRLRMAKALALLGHVQYMFKNVECREEDYNKSPRNVASCSYIHSKGLKIVRTFPKYASWILDIIWQNTDEQNWKRHKQMKRHPWCGSHKLVSLKWLSYPKQPVDSIQSLSKYWCRFSKK